MSEITKAALQGRPSNTNKSTFDTTRRHSFGQNVKKRLKDHCENKHWINAFKTIGYFDFYCFSEKKKHRDHFCFTHYLSKEMISNQWNYGNGAVEPTTLKRVANLQLCPGCAQNFVHPFIGYAQFWRHPTIGYRSLWGCTAMQHTPEISRSFYRCEDNRNAQPFGSMPRDCSSFLNTRLIHVASEESPSFFISVSSCARNSCWRRIWYWSVLALSLDIVITKSILSAGGCNYNVTEMVLQLLNTAKPRSARTLTGPLTKPLIEVTVMAGSQHTQTHLKFTWRFLAVPITTPDINPIVLYTNAANEQDARDNCPGWMLFFAARLPVQEVRHV
jgi:hypothetical protein